MSMETNALVQKSIGADHNVDVRSAAGATDSSLHHVEDLIARLHVHTAEIHKLRLRVQQLEEENAKMADTVADAHRLQDEVRNLRCSTTWRLGRLLLSPILLLTGATKKAQ
jgi:hypothetical protein